MVSATSKSKQIRFQLRLKNRKCQVWPSQISRQIIPQSGTGSCEASVTESIATRIHSHTKIFSIRPGIYFTASQ